MAVTVRLFAALREAAGTSSTNVQAGPLPSLIGELSERYGEPFSSRVRVASVMVDGDTVDPSKDIEVADQAEVVLLPPFSGGSAVVRGLPPSARRAALLHRTLGNR